MQAVTSGALATAATEAPTESHRAEAQRALRDAFGAFATGITVITALGAQGEPIGLTVNSFSSVSLDPPLVAWSLRKASPLVTCFTPGRSLSIHVLGQAQEHLARSFARSATDRFAGIPWQPGFDAVPRLEQVLARFDCRTVSVVDAGDHVLLLARVEDHASEPGPPLLFAAGRFRTLSAPQACDSDAYNEGVWL
jgi:flavin reductase (DIM6/NTAB) family NADH-FMN oxidoreductase RutF